MLHCGDTDFPDWKKCDGRGQNNGGRHIHYYVDPSDNPDEGENGFFNYFYSPLLDDEAFWSCGSPTVADPVDETVVDPVGKTVVDPVDKTVVGPVETTTSTPTITITCDSGSGSNSHFWDFESGDSQFIGLPVLPIGVKSISDLWEVFVCELEHRGIVFGLVIDGNWTYYRGEDNKIGETTIDAHTGINVNLNSWMSINGEAVIGEEIELEKGVHFIGLPEIPLIYKRPSDLLSNKVAWVKVRTDKKNNSPYRYIYADGDDGDDLFKIGQGFVIRVVENITLDLRGEVLAAPSIVRKGKLATTWGEIKKR